MDEEQIFQISILEFLNKKLNNIKYNDCKIILSDIHGNRNLLVLTIDNNSTDNLNKVSELYILRKKDDNIYYFLNGSLPTENNFNFTFNLSEEPTPINLVNFSSLDCIYISNSLSTVVISYTDNYKNKRLHVIKSTFPCFLGKCFSINKILPIDRSFYCRGITNKTTDENNFELNYEMKVPYEDNLILNITIYNKENNIYDFEIVSNSHDEGY